MATIKDIAREAGVAQGTVSNVLNNTGKVSAEKIRRVKEAAARLGYVPNIQASLLRQGAAKTVAVIVPTLHEATYLDFYSTIQSTLQTAGYETNIYTTNDADSIEISVLEKIRVSAIAAVVTISTLSARCSDIYQIFPCPVIYVERKPLTMRCQDAFCGFDNITIAQNLADHLSYDSRKRVALFMSSKHFQHTQDAVDYLDEAVKAKGIELIRFTSDLNLSLSTAFDIAQSSPPFDAVICIGSTCTSAIDTAYTISPSASRPTLISLDNASIYHSSSFKSYALDFHHLGASASEALLARISLEENPATEVILAPTGFRFHFPHVSRVDPTTITMFTLDNPSTNALRKLLPMFESISGIKVELVCVSYEELHARLDHLTQESPYDIIRIDMADFPQLGNRLYSPLSEVLPPDLLRKQLHADIYERYSLIGGIPYAVPFDPSVMLFLYRQDLFSNTLLQRAYYEEFHEKLEVPTSIERYLRTAQFFTRSVFPQSPTEFGSTTTCGSDATFASDFLTFYLGSGGHIVSDNQLQPLNSPEMIDAMVQYKKMQQFTCKQQWWRDSLRQFASGNVAMTIIYSNYASDVINTRYSNIVGQVGAAVLPGGHPLLGGGVIGVSRFSQKQEACRQFLSWFYSDDIAALMVRLGGTSPLASAYNDFSSALPWLPAKKESIACGTRGIDNTEIPGFSIRRYEFAIGTAIQKLVLEDIPPEHAAVMAQTLYDYYK